MGPRRRAIAVPTLAGALVGALLGACAPPAHLPAAAVTPHELCEAVGAFKPPSFYCVGERSRTTVGTLGPHGRPLTDTLVRACWRGQPPPSLRVEAQPLDPAKLSFGFDLMADDRGRIPAAQVFPWSGGEAFLHADPGAVAHVRYSFERARRERLEGVREALQEAPDSACLDALCYRSYDVSLERYVARPRVTVEVGSGRIGGLGVQPGEGSTYTIDPHEELVVATRVQPGPAFAGDLCRISAAEKARGSAETLATELLRTSPCLLTHAVADLLNTACGGRACTPTAAEGWSARRLGDAGGTTASVCQAVQRELARQPALHGRALQCGPDLAAFTAANAGVRLGDLFAGGSATLGLLRALLDEGSDPAMAAAIDWMSLRPGAWLDAQQTWVAARQYDGELPGAPATTWRGFRVAVLRKALETLSRAAPTGIAAACESAGILWTTTGWEVVARGSEDWQKRAPFLPSRAHGAADAARRLVAALSAR